jgi:hypothetical protein
MTITAGATAHPLFTTATQATKPLTEITVVHGIPRTPVDVHLDADLALEDSLSDTVTEMITLAPGSYSVAIRP